MPRKPKTTIPQDSAPFTVNDDKLDQTVYTTDPAPEQGFICCGREMAVYYTRKDYGAVRRVRICKLCGHKKPTTEK